MCVCVCIYVCISTYAYIYITKDEKYVKAHIDKEKNVVLLYFSVQINNIFSLNKYKYLSELACPSNRCQLC